MAIGKYNMDMTTGNLPVQFVKYMVPLALTYLLQLIFHVADLAVIGHFASSESVAAIGVTATPTAAFINIFTGLSVGANALVAQLYGARDNKTTVKATHSAITLALIAGGLVLIIGLLTSRALLKAVNVPDDIMDKSLIYFRLYIAGAPLLLLYNFGCAILRSIGDSRRPLSFLIVAGFANVLLNLLLVVVFKMDVSGVALATFLSHLIAAGLVMRTLMTTHGITRIYIKRLHLDAHCTKRILHIGIPSSIQSACFSLSNLLILGAMNTFGTVSITANTIAINLESFIYGWNYAVSQSAISFCGQNLGAKNFKRIISTCRIALIYGFVICSSIGIFMILNAEFLVSFFVSDPNEELMQWVMLRMKIMFVTYGMLGTMDALSGSLRGLGYSVAPMITTILGTCVFRVLWLKTIFVWSPTMGTLFVSYPISWFIITVFSFILLHFIIKKISGNRYTLLPKFSRKAA